MSIPVTDLIDTTAPSDTYATHNSTRGKGGLHECTTLVERDAITAARRTVGMLAYVADTGLYYTLQADLTSWVALATGGGGTGVSYAIMLSSLSGNRDVCYTNEILTSLAGAVMVDLAGNVMTSPLSTTARVPDFTLDINGDVMMGIV